MIPHTMSANDRGLQKDCHTKDTDSDLLDQLADPATRDEAARLIFQKYAEQLLNLIRSRLSDSLQKRTEPQDIMQSVWKSFFSRTFELRDTESLFPLLAEMCVRKASSAARRNTAQKRSVDREISIDGEADADGFHHVTRPGKRRFSGTDYKAPAAEVEPINDKNDSSLDLSTCQLMVRGATPAQAAIAIELFNSLPDALQEIMRLRLEGFHDEEIAKTLGCTRRTVVRKAELIRSHLRSRKSDDQ